MRILVLFILGRTFTASSPCLDRGRKPTRQTIVPFSTSGGSGLGATPRQLKSMNLGAEIKEGFTIYGQDAQNQKETTRNTVREWLKSEGYLK